MATRQRMVVVVSGPVAGGKSALARGLERRFDGLRLSTRSALMSRLAPNQSATRETLQRIGAEWDAETGGSWVADRLGRDIWRARERGNELVMIDAARIAGQVEGLRSAFGREVRHVHVTASRETCAERYAGRQSVQEFEEAADYATVLEDPTERAVDDLAPLADIVIDTDRDGEDDVLVRVAAQLGLLDRSHTPCVDVLVGGQYGSEGKGNIAYHLAPEYDLLVRVGGPNAAHKVPLPSGDFTHFQLPSGTQNGEAKLLIGPGAVLSLDELFDEISRSDVDKNRLSIDPQAMVIEASDKEAEAELRERIASTASGAGSATARRVMRGEAVRLARDVSDLEPFRRPASEILEEAYASGARIMLEGTQGSGLSLYHGRYPSVTSRDTNVAGCLAEAGIAPARVRRTIMVVRSYPIRVGGPSGYMRTPISWEEIERRAELPEGTLSKRELTSKTKTLRRVGEFEWDLVRKAALLNAPTDIALTFADYLAAENRDAWRFEQLSKDSLRFIDELERVTGARVSLISVGFEQYSQRILIDRRDW
jgi:adenylosuccinate synthase